MNIFELEKKYKEILENIEEWVYLRTIMANYLRDRNNQEEKNRESSKNIIRKLQKVKTILYGFKNWFAQYDGLVFRGIIYFDIGIENYYVDYFYNFIISHTNIIFYK